jgi:hypothetical protein
MAFQFVDYAVFASHPSSQRSGVPEGVNFPTICQTGAENKFCHLAPLLGF